MQEAWRIEPAELQLGRLNAPRFLHRLDLAAVVPDLAAVPLFACFERPDARVEQPPLVLLDRGA